MIRGRPSVYVSQEGTLEASISCRLANNGCDCPIVENGGDSVAYYGPSTIPITCPVGVTEKGRKLD